MTTEQTARLAGVRRGLWRYSAEVRRIALGRGSARTALASLDDPQRSDADAWIEATSSRHDDYRRDHPVPGGRVAVVCVSMRPNLLDAVVANIARQRDVEMEVVFVANAAQFDMRTVEAAFAPLENSVLIHPPARTSLGSALNLAMDMTDARFIAKFDDDDLYGSHFLADSLRAHGYAGAGIVGKHTYYARMAETGATHLRFPANEFRYTGTLAGGTLVLDRERIGDQRFDDVSLGEDRAFLAQCHRRGFSTFSTDRFNFVQMRTGVNTWAIDDARFLERSVPVDSGEAAEIDR
jgi:hypothetical protein